MQQSAYRIAYACSPSHVDHSIASPGKSCKQFSCLRRIWLALSAITLVLVSPLAIANTTVLIVVEREDCIYCKKFDREIAQAYPLTDEGKQAPLIRIQADQWPKEYAQIQKESLTPTFILVHKNEEVSRLRGYPGDEYFWFLLGEMLEKLPENS